MDFIKQIQEKNALRKANILKGFNEINEALEIEKAKNRPVGEIHPNGKWVWKEIKPGKFDWRTIPKGEQKTESSDSKSEKRESKEVPTMKTFSDLAKNSKDVDSFISEVKKIKNVPKDVADEFFKKYGNDGDDDIKEAATKFFNEHKKVNKEVSDISTNENNLSKEEKSEEEIVSELVEKLKHNSIDTLEKKGYSKSMIVRANSILMRKTGGGGIKPEDDDRFGDDEPSKQYYNKTL